MKMQIQKWGNSLALRIPKPFAMQTNLSNGSSIDVSVVDGSIVLTPTVDEGLTLSAMLEQITPENTHAECNFGTIGNEEL